MPICLRCGLCCYIIEKDENDQPYININKKCQNLVTLPSGNKICRNYNNRLGTIMKKEGRCSMRSEGKYDYPNCPFNSGKQMVYPKNE